MFRQGKTRDHEYRGRNGYGLACGVSVRHHPWTKCIVVEPINSRGFIATGCSVPVPEAELGQFIIELQRLRAELITKRIHERTSI